MVAYYMVLLSVNLLYIRFIYVAGVCFRFYISDY